MGAKPMGTIAREVMAGKHKEEDLAFRTGACGKWVCQKPLQLTDERSGCVSSSPKTRGMPPGSSSSSGGEKKKPRDRDAEIRDLRAQVEQTVFSAAESGKGQWTCKVNRREKNAVLMRLE